jgi:ubiquinone/menaquinone biosynthesis C-methylase UbiE
MNKSDLILLPGLDKQLTFLKSRLELSELQVLIMGSGTAIIAKQLQSMGNNVEVIVEDYDSLMNAKLEISGSDEVNVKIMDFERTDYSNEKFDLVYVQGSISDARRKKIVKEIKRVLNQDGHLCLGDMVNLSENPPIFVKELFAFSKLEPLYKENLIPYYEERNFELVDSIDLSFTLREYYSINTKMLSERNKSLSSNEKSYYKKILNQISHESNAYLKLGANKFIGFHALLLKKK